MGESGIGSGSSSSCSSDEYIINAELNADLCHHNLVSAKSVSTAYPLLTSKFYSIYNILYSLNDPTFEDGLVTNTMKSLTKSRVDSISFYFPNVDERTLQQCSYVHDLFLRIDNLFQ